MAAEYSLWLTDQFGNRIDVIDNWIELSYTRAVNDVGELVFLLPIDYEPKGFLRPDARIALYRKILQTKYLETETVWFIREIDYITKQNSEQLIVIKAYSCNEVLSRRVITYDSSASQSSGTDKADDLMKYIWRHNFSGSATDSNRDISSYISVESNEGLGPTVSKDFSYDNVLKVMQDLSQSAITAGSAIYFDVVAPTVETMEFRTYSQLRGIDHTRATGVSPVVLSTNRGNLSDVTRSFNWRDEKTFVYAGGTDRIVGSASSSDRIKNSPLNRREFFTSVRNSASANLNNEAESALRTQRPKRTFSGRILDIPGTTYGVHWGWGDKLTVEAFGDVFDCTIDAIHVSIKGGKETVTGTLRVVED